MSAEPPRLSPRPEVGRRYASLPRRDTAAELALRRELHRRGRRYRVNARVVGISRRTVDVLFTRHRVAVFVDGCFWHGCTEHLVVPKTNRDWWLWKLQTNQDRDADTTARLETLGWTVLRIWEHVPPADAADRVEALLLVLTANRHAHP